jgi:ribosomal protein S20
MGKRLQVLGLIAAGVLALATVCFGATTLVHATQGDDRPAPRELVEEFLSRVAGKLGVSKEELSGAIESTELEMVDEAVADGRISEETAERLRSRIEEGKGFLGLPVCRPRGPVGPRIDARIIRAGLHLVVDPAADVLGMERQELVGELREGKSLAEIAEEQDVSVEVLKSGILDGVAAKLEKAVSNGRLGEERAERILQRLTERIDDIIKRTLPSRLGGPDPAAEG